MKQFVHPKSKQAERQQSLVARSQRIESQRTQHKSHMNRDNKILSSFVIQMGKNSKQTYSLTDIRRFTISYIASHINHNKMSPTQKLTNDLFLKELIQKTSQGLLKVPDLTDIINIDCLLKWDGSIESSQRIKYINIEIPNIQDILDKQETI